MANNVVKNLNSQSAEAPQIVEQILKLAIQMNASDIHIGKNNSSSTDEPYLLRFRANGVLQKVDSHFLNSIYREVIARIKVLSKMDITITAIPQDGKFNIQANNENIGFRVNISPGINSIEEVCIRLNRSKGREFQLDDMLMTTNMRAQVDQLIHQKSGMFIMNGPAGQGKTTTIYAILRELAGPQKKIITAEDPVEKEIPFVSHNQISSRVSFADFGRSFMRQDAEVIFIGEIRDEDSALSAQQLAQTGHLVLSTIHTRDSIGVVSRLLALGVDANAIATTLIGSLAQRLAPALCQHCKIPIELDKHLHTKLNSILPIQEGVQFCKKGPGCESCNKYINNNLISSGYEGSIPVFELFVIDDEISEMINQQKTHAEILAKAQSKGMLTLSQEALLRVYQGFIDFESVRGLVLAPSY
ncbi:MAG: Flp pilus assembly complex ATPase component TadA [Bdellovibrionaceae bacterium]|nr:Flp pilus assembly complex ATPase component TadA [Pseudobdellovibrionaceae bacterium]